MYVSLAERESVTSFRNILTELAALSKESFGFWTRKSNVLEDSLGKPRGKIMLYRFMRRVLGLTLTAKYISGRKADRVARYKTYCVTCTVDEDYKVIETFADRMEAVVSEIEEERVVFFSNIILGFNDALIELTGALVGFSFALKDPKLITVGGLITGISASMSMAASAFLQARHEEGKNPIKAALFTGVAYFVIALVLVLPFIFASSIASALMIMFVLIVLMIMCVSFYSAILLDRTYISQFLEMLLLSLGVAVIAFIIGQGISGYLDSV